MIVTSCAAMNSRLQRAGMEIKKLAVNLQKSGINAGAASAVLQAVRVLSKWRH